MLHVTLTRNGAAAKPSMAFAALRLAGERQGFPREPAAIVAALHVTLTRNGAAAKPCRFRAAAGSGDCRPRKTSAFPAVDQVEKGQGCLFPREASTGILPVFAWPVAGNAKGCPDGQPRSSRPRGVGRCPASHSAWQWWRGCPCAESRRVSTSAARMAKRCRHRVSEGHEGRSERPANGARAAPSGHRSNQRLAKHGHPARLRLARQVTAAVSCYFTRPLNTLRTLSTFGAATAWQ